MKKINLPEYDAEVITLDNLCRYEDVFYCNKEYYMITDGRAATKADCVETIEYCIEGIPKNKIHNIGFSDNGVAVACLFLIEEYPNADTLWIGLLLVHNQYKRKHIGLNLINALISALKETTIKYIRLSVHDNNISGLSFWKHMGFTIVEKTDCGAYINLTMEYLI